MAEALLSGSCSLVVGLRAGSKDGGYRFNLWATLLLSGHDSVEKITGKKMKTPKMQMHMHTHMTT